jgi:tetratricopeptide (TPR) repeat protein
VRILGRSSLSLFLAALTLFALSLPDAAAESAPPGPKPSCAQGEALADAGQKAKAEAVYVKVLEANPKEGCASTGLEGLKSSKAPWEWAATAGTDAGHVLAFLVLGTLTVLALALLVLQPLTRIPKLRDLPPGRYFLKPNLEVKTLEAEWMTSKLGGQVASLIRARVTPRRDGGVDIVTGQAAFSDSLKPLADVSSEAKSAVAIATLLESTLPRRNFEVNGALQPEGESGRGITVELTNDKRFLGATTLWEREFDVPDDEVKAFQRLAVPAAAWIDHFIATAVGVGDRLLSQNPQSWAMFKTGAARQEAGEFDEAKALYERALGIDPDNAGALANLGALEMQGQEYEEALAHLESALAKLGGESA